MTVTYDVVLDTPGYSLPELIELMRATTPLTAIRYDDAELEVTAQLDGLRVTLMTGTPWDELEDNSFVLRSHTCVVEVPKAADNPTTRTHVGRLAQAFARRGEVWVIYNNDFFLGSASPSNQQLQLASAPLADHTDEDSFALIEQDLSIADDGHVGMSHGRFERCTLRDWQVGSEHDACLRPEWLDITFSDCEAADMHVGPVIMRNVVIDALRGEPMYTYGCVFDRVKLRGNISGFTATEVRTWSAATRLQFLHANTQFYKTVDWALDIREANFVQQPDLSGIPQALIIR